MKQVIFSCALIALTANLFAQTNTFLPTGNAILSGFNSTTGNSNAIFFGNTATGEPKMSLFYVNNATMQGGLIDVQAGSSNVGALSQTIQGLRIRTGTTTTNGTSNMVERMRITADGRVGINTSNQLNAATPVAPFGMLQVETQSSLTPSMVSTTIGSSQRAFSVGTRNTTTNTYTENTSILGNGNVLIGKKADGTNLATPTGYKLFVKDGILTERLKVASSTDPINWADYVFAPDYQLKPLSEVEAFVKENKHLPNIPSAATVAKEGLDMAEMFAKQMEKIEELTLYMIQLNKKVETLEKENATLKTAISTQMEAKN